MCGAQASSGDVTSLPEARRIIAEVSRGGDPGAEAVAWLRDLRRPLDKWRLERSVPRGKAKTAIVKRRL